jgi:hypothetical protein
MGRSAGQWFAQLERSGTRARRLAGSIGRRLGGIEVLTRNDGGKWVRAGEVRETGPLASDVHLVPLPGRSHGSRQIRLVLTKGYWRVDYVALALLGGGVEALRIRPSAVLRDSLPVATALVTLRERTGALTTSPGDIYTMTYELPGNYQDYELFLESRGYYLEWMRDEWLAEENPQRATMMFRNPAEALRLLAPQFKAMESEIERQFWNSRYAR